MDQKRVLKLKADAEFRTARSWDVFARYAISHGDKEMTIPAGTWLLELGPQDYSCGTFIYQYRLVGGEVVTRQTPLVEGQFKVVRDPQIRMAMNAYRDIDTVVEEDFGLNLDRLCRGLPPFALIRCPLCGGTDFTTCDLASVWCDKCNAQFSARPTSGDPGFVVDVHWEHYSMGSAVYLLPPVRTLIGTLVLKDSNNPRDMSVNGCDCKEGEVRLTDQSTGLRPGLHECNIGTLYDWRKVYGQVPRPEDLSHSSTSWTVDGVQWPQSATERVLSLSYGERSYLDIANYWLDKQYENVKNGLAALSKIRSTQLDVFEARFPDAAELGKDERYLLHHWVTIKKNSSSGDYELAVPVWYVVTPVVEDRWIKGWNVVRKDICPVCGKRILPEHLNEGQYKHSYDDPHHGCRESWASMTWLKEMAPATA